MRITAGSGVPFNRRTMPDPNTGLRAAWRARTRRAATALLAGLAGASLAGQTPPATAPAASQPATPPATQPSGPPPGTDAYTLGPDSQPQTGVPRGKVEGPLIWKSRIFPNTTREYWIYVPAQYDASVPAAVMV